MTPRAAALLYMGLTAIVVTFHLAMLLGAPWGHLTMGGRWPGVLPLEWRWLSVLSALILVGIAYVVAASAGLVTTRPPRWVIHVVLLYMGLAVAVHVATPSVAERALWLPQILVMLACAVRVAFARSHDSAAKTGPRSGREG